MRLPLLSIWAKSLPVKSLPAETPSTGDPLVTRPPVRRQTRWRWIWLGLGLLLACLQSSGTLAAQSARPRFSFGLSDGWSWLNTPEGTPFFSLGVCVATPGQRREDFDRENPGYAAWQYYPDTAQWADSTAQRLKSWGFTTVGAWGDAAAFLQVNQPALHLTPVLHLGSAVGAPWWDMWDKRLVERMDRIARDQILPLRGNPRVIGYFSDNELGWWNATLWKMTLEHAPSSGQRQRLIQLLRTTYREQWNELLKDFEPENASNWRELQKGGMLYLRPGGEGVRIQRQFLGILASRYYEIVSGLIRKYDPQALVLGDRYQSFYYPEVVRAAAPWVDAISMNLNPSWSDGSFLRCQLETLHALANKPIWISEFYMAARENRSGNRNSHGVFPTVETQAERARAVTTTLHQLARAPYVVAADWFQYFDEPRHGRADGENFNFGLVDIQNRPYSDVCSAFQEFKPHTLRASRLPPRLDALSGIPPAPKDPLGNFTANQALQPWDRERGFVPPTSPLPLADLYVCWNADALYLGLFALDITEDAVYRDRWVPKRDRASWSVRIDQRHSFHARIGAGREAIPSRPDLRMENLSGVNLSVRNIAALQITAAQLGRDRLRAGDRIELTSEFSGHLQAHQVKWRGNFVLRP